MARQPPPRLEWHTAIRCSIGSPNFSIGGIGFGIGTGHGIGDIGSPCFQTSSFSVLFGSFSVADAEQRQPVKIYTVQAEKSTLGKVQKHTENDDA